MIVKVLPKKPAGTGRPLATYILDLKHEIPGERLGAYIPGLDTHKVEWSRHSNINADSQAAAIAAIEWHNAQNLRKHRISRWEHIVVSFAEGEKPTREQMAVIEDRLMEAIGFGDHPRISAVHRNTDNLHLHIGISRIDPTTLRAEHPRHNHFKLQAEAARLELDLGLRQERKTLLTRERQEIDSRQALARELDHRIAIDGTIVMFPKEETHASMAEETTSVEFTRMELHQLARAHDLFERQNGPGGPSTTPGVPESLSAKLEAAMGPPGQSVLNQTASVELTRSELYAAILRNQIISHDIPSQHPDHQARTTEKLEQAEKRLLSQEQTRASMQTPNFLQRLFSREGSPTLDAELKDAAKQEQKHAEWVKNFPRELEPSRADFERTAAINAANRKEQNQLRELHNNYDRPTPANALYARYKSEYAIALGARNEATQAVYDRFSAYHQGLSAHYTVRYEQEKLNPRQPHRIERQQSRELLRAERIGDRVQAQQMRAQQLAAARKEHPLPTWDKFLERESQRGDREAARILQRKRTRDQQHQRGHER